MLDLYVGYNEQALLESLRSLSTPFGALKLFTLPMEWTNSVSIFHDNVTFILQPQILRVTILFIDDMPIKGPISRYRNDDSDRNEIVLHGYTKFSFLLNPLLIIASAVRIIGADYTS